MVKQLREADDQFRRGSKVKAIKFIERAGVSLKDTLVPSNPWGDQKCGRATCFICRGEKGGMKFCMKENVLYSICCEECRREEKRVEYWGETGRDCFSRGEEHIKSYSDRCEDSTPFPEQIHRWQVQIQHFQIKFGIIQFKFNISNSNSTPRHQ